MRFENKVAIVTGAASGLGLGLSSALAAEGARVVMADVNLEGVQAAAKTLSDQGYSVLPVKADQTCQADIASLLKAAVDAFGRVDCLYANAGIGIAKPILKLTEADWRKIMDVNVIGTFMICQAVASQFIAQGGGGNIVVTSSQGALLAQHWFAAYCCSKAAVSMLVRCLSMELGNYRIRVNGIQPATFETPMSKDLLYAGNIGKNFKSCTPAGRWGQVDDIVKAAIFLASEDAEFINGHLLTIDGGNLNNPAFQYFYTDYAAGDKPNWKTQMVLMPPEKK